MYDDHKFHSRRYISAGKRGGYGAAQQNATPEMYAQSSSRIYTCCVYLRNILHTRMHLLNMCRHIKPERTQTICWHRQPHLSAATQSTYRQYTGGVAPENTCHKRTCAHTMTRSARKVFDIYLVMTWGGNKYIKKMAYNAWCNFYTTMINTIVYTVIYWACLVCHITELSGYTNDRHIAHTRFASLSPSMIFNQFVRVSSFRVSRGICVITTRQLNIAEIPGRKMINLIEHVPCV